MFVEPCDAPQFAALVEQVRAERAADRRAVAERGGGFRTARSREPWRWCCPSGWAPGSWSRCWAWPAEPTLKEPQLFDGVGEFANMVCGAWLSKASETRLVHARRAEP